MQQDLRDVRETLRETLSRGIFQKPNFIQLRPDMAQTTVTIFQQNLFKCLVDFNFNILLKIKDFYKLSTFHETMGMRKTC